jgi:hypothetical protein
LIEREFTDEGVSGAVVAAQRPGFSDLLSYIRSGNAVLSTLHLPNIRTIQASAFGKLFLTES